MKEGYRREEVEKMNGEQKMSSMEVENDVSEWKERLGNGEKD